MIALVAALAAPLAAAVFLAGAGRRWPERCGAVAAVAAALPLPLLLLAPAGARGEATWFGAGRLAFTVGLRGDGLARATALLVAAVSAAVMIFAASYMQHHAGRPRFFAWMCFFEGAMLALVLADSLLVLFAGWEGVGVASWALIGHEHAEERARRAADKAFLVTRAGDLALLVALALALVATGSTRVDALLAAARAGELAPAVPIAFLCLAAAVTKSAQLPATAWLPDAMAGPTPVSALLHSATMVAAGVFLLLRLWPLFEAVPAALLALRVVAAATALAGALVASAQDDLKRVLAWSTVDQLGLMMLALALGGPRAAGLQLFAHAAYKSALFLAAGAVDEATGTRALSRLGAVGRKLPLVAGTFVAAALSLAAVPPLAGFWSADRVLGAARAASPAWAALVLLLGFLSGAYVARAAAAVFGRWPGAPAPAVRPLSAALRWPAALLASAAVMGGVFASRLGGALGLPESPAAPLAWRAAAILASAAGLATGALRVRRAGPVPTFGAGGGLVRPIEALVSAFGPAARGAASGAVRADSALAAGARALAAGAGHLAAALGVRLEGAFGRGTRTLGRATLQAGARARAVESGQLYLYTAATAACAAAAVLAGALAWLLVAPPIR